MDKDGTNFFQSALESWPKTARAILIIFVVFGCIFGIGYWFSHYTTISEFKLTSSGAELKFESKDSTENYKTVLVHPGGWVETGIELYEGDEVNISAYGVINIAFGSMVQASLYEHNLKEKHKNAINQYTSDDIDSSTYRYPWNAPTGIPPNFTVGANKSIRIDSTANLGQLLAVVCPNNACLSIDVPKSPLNEAQIEPFYNKNKGLKFTTEKRGELRFIVNDVTNPDFSKNNLGWQDNIGFFSVNLRIVRKKK